MEDEGLSLLDIWKLIMKKKMIASIAFGISTILMLILILYVYNPMGGSYEVSFFYQWEGIEQGKYANGAIFNRYETVSLESLNEVKNSKAEFANIDTLKLSERITLKTDEEFYLLKAPSSYFKNDKEAKEFIERLIYLPINNALNLDFDFTSNLTGYVRSKKISMKLTYLQNQLNLLSTGYQDMISRFGDIQVLDSNLSTKLRQVEVFQTNNDLHVYEYQAYKNAYMTKEEYENIVKEKEVLLTEQELLRARKQVLLDSLKNIYSSSNGNTYMDTSIANYLNNLHTLDSRLMKIDEDLRLYDSASLGIYNEEESQLFLKTLEEYKANLETLTTEYTKTVQEVLNKNTLIHFDPIKVKGKISIWLAIPISVIFGIVVGLLLAFVWAYFKENRLRAKEL